MGDTVRTFNVSGDHILNIEEARKLYLKSGAQALIAFGGGSLAEEALYLAAIQSYRGAKYSESGSLFRRYRRNFPSGSHADEAQTMAAKEAVRKYQQKVAKK